MADESKSTGPKKVPYSAVDDESLVLHYVRVDIVKATGLRNADLVGKSDPFCEATVNQLVRTTPVVQDSLDPVWNSTFHYFVQDKPDVVDFKLWDEDDNLKNDLLGDAQLKLAPLWDAKTPQAASFAGDLPVTYSGKQKGTITVKAYVRLMLPVKTEKKLEHTTKELEKSVGVVAETKSKLAETDAALGATKGELEEKAKALGLTTEELEAKRKEAAEKGELLEYEKELKRKVEEALEEKAQALGLTTEELVAKRKEAEEKGQLLEFEKDEKRKVSEALEEKAKALGLTTDELAAKTKEAHEKTAALAKEQEEKAKISAELKQKYDKMMELQKQLEENKNDEDYLVIHLIHVTVVSAKGVRNADIGGKSDPYTEAIVQGLSRKTPVIQNDLNPVWNTNFAFFTQNQPACIDFKLWDEDDHGKDDPLGDCKLELKEYFKTGELFDGSLPIIYKGKQAGVLNLKVYCKIMHPVQTEKKLEETSHALTKTSEQKKKVEEDKKKVEEDLGKTSAELESKYKELGDLTKGNKDLKDKFDGLIDKLAIAEVGVKQKTEEVVHLERENGELRAKLTSEAKVASDSKITSDFIVTENEKLKAEHEKSQTKDKENHTKIDTLEKRVNELEKEVKESHEKLKEAETKVKEAETKAAKSPTTTAPAQHHTTPAATTSTTKPTEVSKPAEEKVAPKEVKVRESRPSITGKAFGYSDKAADRAFLIKVNVLKGIGIRNAVLMGTIDPYCQLVAGDLSLVRTKCVRATLNPEWNEHANFLGEKGQKLPNDLKVAVYDEGQYFSSTLIGEGSLSLKELWERGGVLEKDVELSHIKKGASGKVQLRVTCTSVDS